MAQILRLENLKIVNKIGGSEIILAKDLNVMIDEKEWVTFIIPHGGGKTSLYKILLSQIKPTSGKIIYTNKDKMDEYDKMKFLREDISAIPETPTFIDNFSVKDWVNLQIEILRPKKYRARLKEYYKFLESQKINLEKSLYQLTLLEMRKLEVSLSILSDTILLICDDIDIGLSKEDLANLENFLKEINKSKAVIMISSNPTWTKFAKKVIRL